MTTDPLKTHPALTAKTASNSFSKALTAYFGIALGLLLILWIGNDYWEHYKLKTEGVTASGRLEMITKNRRNGVTTGYDFRIAYAGRTRSFAADESLFSEHAQPDGTFTQHELSVIYLPDQPEIASLPSMLRLSNYQLFGVLFGVVIAALGFRSVQLDGAPRLSGRGLGKRCKISLLNPETRDYLKSIWQNRGAGHPGIFMQGSQLARNWVVLVIGVFMVGLALWRFRGTSLFFSMPWQCALLSVGLGCVIFPALSIMRRGSSHYLGDFIYLDGSYRWEVGTTNISVTDLTQVSNVQLVEQFAVQRKSFRLKEQNRTYSGCEVRLTLPNAETLVIPFSARNDGLLVAKFLSVCVDLRQRAATRSLPSGLNWISESAGLFAQAARRCFDVTLSASSPKPGNTIPIPAPSALPDGRFPFAPAVLQLTTILTVFLICWAVLPPTRASIQHNHYYELAKYSAETDLEPLKAYLARFPEGKHHEAITALLDDRRFAIAGIDAQTQNSPSPLREYLAEAPNQRNQAEAQQLINQFYDSAIARVRELAANRTSDQTLLPGLLAILDYLKAQPTPHARIAFNSKVVIEPDDARLRSAEQEFQSFYAEGDPVVRSMVQDQGTAILPASDTFSEKQIQRREAIILNRLGAAVANILSGDIIQFHQVAPDEKNEILVSYEIKPRGSLIKYVRVPEPLTARELNRRANQAQPTNTLGLLREYTIGWRLAIHPGLSGQPFTYDLNSNPGTNLLYRSSLNDPDWGVYAVMMYSTFHDFANQMISAVGLTPPKAPRTFTFQEAVSQ